MEKTFYCPECETESNFCGATFEESTSELQLNPYKKVVEDVYNYLIKFAKDIPRQQRFDKRVCRIQDARQNGSWHSLQKLVAARLPL